MSATTTNKRSSANPTKSADYLERLSRALTLFSALAAVVALFTAPLLALGWRQIPFPGFLVEPTLVINEVTSPGWKVDQVGPGYPQQVVRMNGQPLDDSAAYRQVLENQQVGNQVSLITRLPDGRLRLYPAVILKAFTTQDLWIHFWYPFLIGLVYFAIGVWVYQTKGMSRPGRALAFFSFTTSVVCTTLFDAFTTHRLSALWTLAISMVGGSLFSLAMRFPAEWQMVRKRPWVLGIPYGIAMLLALGGILSLSNRQSPWAYIDAWGYSYRYIALAVLFFLGSTLYYSFSASKPLVRQQSRVVFLGSLIAFLPITIFFLAPLFNLDLPFSSMLFFTTLLAFPISMILAIMRYRLWEVDLLVNRALVYGALTAILAGLFTALTLISRSIFMTLTGERSDVAIIITTFIVGALAAPLRARLQTFVDRRLKDTRDDTASLRLLGERIRNHLQISDPDYICQQLLEQTIKGLDAQAAAINQRVNDEYQTVYQSSDWRGEAVAVIPLDYGGERQGLLFVAPSRDGHRYGERELAALQDTASQTAHLLHQANLLHPNQAGSR